MLKSTVVILFILSLSNSFAGIIENWAFKTEHFYLTDDSGNEYRAARTGNPKGEPILFLHGFGGNHHNVMDLAYRMKNSDVDIWSLEWMQNESIETSFSETLPLLIDYVFEQTRRPITIVAHSLGGIAFKLTCSGIRQTNGKWALKKSVRDWCQEKIKKAYYLGSPNGALDESISTPLQIRNIGALTALVNLFPFAKNTILNTKNFTDIILDNEATKHINILNKISIEESIWLSLFNINKSFLNLSNLKRKNHDFERLLFYSSKNIPKKIKKDVSRWLSLRKIVSRDNTYVFENIFYNIPSPIPIAFIAGEYDGVAQIETIKREANFQKSDFFVLPKTGHVDLFIGISAIKLADIIASNLGN